MLKPHAPTAARRPQTGLALIESLVALLILAFGVTGLLLAQTRQLADSRDTRARTTAILMAQDLAERMLFNRSAAVRGDYQLAWGEQPSAVDCQGRRCTAEQLARADLSQWRSALAARLPQGDASVFRPGDDARAIGIAIAWPAAGAADDAGTPFAVTVARHGIDCPKNQRCHVVRGRF